MILKYISLLLFTLSLWIFNGQNTPLTKDNSNQGVVKYKFILNLFEVEAVQTASLYFDDRQSMFIYSQGKKGTVMKKPDGQDLGEDEDLPLNLVSWYQDTIGAVFFKDLAKKKLICREFFQKVPYLTEEPAFPNIKWNISNEEKKIGSFTCQKATTRFRGRNYTAWFTMAIPISNGPWKLHGLPGLILEAVDETGEVKFLFNSIEMPFATTVSIKPPIDGKKVPFEVYKKADEIEFENHKKAVEAMDLGRGTTITLSRGKVNTIEKEYEQ
jgi:GLPGLI family protein